MNKTTALQVHHDFEYISLKSTKLTKPTFHCTTTTWNFLMRHFMKNVKIRRRLSFLFLNLHERVQIDATKTRRSPPNLFLLVVNLADFFENQANEICSHLSDKASKGMFRVKPDELQNHSNEGKGKEEKKEWGERKEEKRKKAMFALLVFIMATLEIFGRKQTGVNVFKNSARNI